MRRLTHDQAVAAATELLRDGYALTMCSDSTPDTGIRIWLSTDQGWSPDPFWQERGDAPQLGSNDTLPD